ncbi:MAG: redoxin domain-containing protein [Chloroflexi bacterium]|nr:redoxin domain-containing protein [Chloroflexota bacterium]
MELNRLVPDFELPALDGRLYRLSDYRGNIVVLNFWSCECPHSERADKEILPALAGWGAGVALLTVASNKNESIEAIQFAAEARRLPVVLLDEDCRAADQFEAQVTPQVFVVDSQGVLRYRGAVDDASFRKKVPSRFFLFEAVEALLRGDLPPLAESAPFGCAIVREI